MKRRLIRHLAGLSGDHPLRRLGRGLRQVPALRPILRRFVGVAGTADITAAALAGARLKPRPVPPDSPEFYTGLLDAAERAAPSGRAVPRRVVLVNTGLAAGGAERQVVNTLLGLAAGASLESVTFLGENLHRAPENAFHLPKLDGSGIIVTGLERKIRLADQGFAGIDRGVANWLGPLPGYFVEEILSLDAAFRAMRPEVVHAWQDSTAIKAAIAAVMAGVPRIVLSSRNVNPSNFGYHLPYMRPAYQALAGRRGIVLSNNSAAGAQDYRLWLDRPDAAFRVLRNGVALDSLARDASGGAVLRGRLGIPADFPVVGSIFRFWPEKRPVLWIEAASRVLARRPETHFLLAGDGPLAGEMRAAIARSPAPAHFHLIPPASDIAPVLSAFDLFLLTSRFEGTPNVVLEAEWLGLPIVALAAGGTAETIDPGVTGLIGQSEAPDDIAASICQILDDPAFTARAATAGPAFVRAHFGPERMIAETLALYGYGPELSGLVSGP